MTDASSTLARRVYEASHLTGTSCCGRVRPAPSTSTSTSSRPTRRCCGRWPRPWSSCCPTCDVLAGMELGGIPIATVMSQLTGLPTVFMRKQAKDVRHLQGGRGAAGRRPAGRPGRGRGHDRRRAAGRDARCCATRARHRDRRLRDRPSAGRAERLRGWAGAAARADARGARGLGRLARRCAGRRSGSRAPAVVRDLGCRAAPRAHRRVDDGLAVVLDVGVTRRGSGPLWLAPRTARRDSAPARRRSRPRRRTRRRRTGRPPPAHGPSGRGAGPGRPALTSSMTLAHQLGVRA